MQFSKVRAMSALIISLLACSAARNLYGQAATASINGTVTDSSGAAIPGGGCDREEQRHRRHSRH